MTSKNEHIVFFDIETTGVDINEDRIIQIGLVKVDQDLNFVDAIEQKINPDGVKSRPEALEKHKIPDEELLQYPKFEEVVDQILDFMEDCDLGGHNIVKFDIPFFMKECERHNKYFTIEKRRLIDTKLLDNHYNFRTLGSIFREYCPDSDLGCEEHDALCDTQMCIEVYKAMLQKHQPEAAEIDEVVGNNRRIDVSGFFVLGDNGVVEMGKGKYAGKPIIMVDPSYFEWMMKQDFPKETINLASRCLAFLRRQI